MKTDCDCLCAVPAFPRNLWRSAMTLLLGIGLLLARPATAQTPGDWSLAGNMSTVRGTPTAIVLTDGTVLVVGGASSAASDLYNPVSNSWTTVGAMSTPRNFQAGTLLANGSVLVAGGQDENGNTLASAEIYNSTTQDVDAHGKYDDAEVPAFCFAATKWRCAGGGRLAFNLLHWLAKSADFKRDMESHNWNVDCNRQHGESTCGPDRDCIQRRECADSRWSKLRTGKPSGSGRICGHRAV